MDIQDNNPLNILSGIYSPFNRFNGSVVFCHNLYKEIINKGNTVHFVGLKTDNLIQTNMKLHLLEGTLTGEADTPEFNHAVTGIKGAFEKILKTSPIDIIHGHHLTFPPSAALASMKFEQPLVITSHASDIEFAQNHPSHREHMRKSLDMADKVVLLSRNLIPILEKIKPDMAFEKIAIIPLGVDEMFFSSEKPERHNEKFTILYSGRLTREKGVHILFDALKALPEAVLRIAGTGNQEEELKNKVNTMNLAERVKFLGFLDRETLKNEYKNADILVVPSQGLEGIPQVCLEGMANYLPVIATDSGGVKEVTEGASIIIPQGDSNKIIEAIIKLYKDLSLREDLSFKGRERVEEYRWERVAHLYLSLFRSLL